MPIRPRWLFARATLHRTRQRGFALPAIALAIATLLPASVAGAGTASPAPAPVFETIDVGSMTPPRRPVATSVDTSTPDVTGLSRDAMGRTWVRADVAGTGAVGVEPGADGAGYLHRVTLLGGTGWSLPGGDTGLRWIPIAWAAGATDTGIAFVALTEDGDLPTSLSMTILADGDAPVATMEPLAVEAGELTLRWSDSDGPGSGIVERDVRIEEAPATAAGCGAFTGKGGVSLGEGDFDPGVLPLGSPPSTGCLRVRLTLTDLVGHTTVTTSKPYRTAPTTAKAPSWSGRFNLYRVGTFVTQKTFTWCVAASVQMMVNIVRHHHDRTTQTQTRMIEYAQLRDNGPYGEDGGTDVTGWIMALRHFGAGNYRAVGTTTASAALRTAAIAMRQTGRPAGILVMDGRHAWVLHGFESRTDPRRDARAWIRAVRISGPLYPVQQKNGYDPSPNSRLTVKALERWFTPSSVGALVGKYVVVIPTH